MRCAVLLLAALAGGCASRTEVLVSVDAVGLDVPAQLERVRISVTNPDETDPSLVVYDSGELRVCAAEGEEGCQPLPITVVLEPGSARRDARVRVAVEGISPAGAVVQHDASSFRFVEDQRQRLGFVLRGGCLGTACATDSLACDEVGTCAQLLPRGGARPILAADQLRFDFGALRPPARATKTFTFQNLGVEASGEVSVELTGDPSFSVGGNSCQGVPLGPPCRVTITYAPDAIGPHAATLTARAAPGGSAAIELVAEKDPARLEATSTPAVPATAIGATRALTWTITNAGGLASGPPTLAVTGAQAADFVASGCALPLAPGASCDVAIAFTPSALGLREAVVTLTANPGGTLTLPLAGTSGYRVIVWPQGPAGGTVTSLPAGVDCGATCELVVPAGTVVTLRARTQNGSGVHFEGWGGGCAGSTQDCALTLNGSVDVDARFAATTSNLVFLSSTKHAATLGGTLPYDNLCNGLATAAGLNSAAGDAFVAMLSASGDDVRTRLGAASGFALRDGAPVGDTQTELFTIGQLFNPIVVTETGERVGTNEHYWTGIDLTGAPSGNDCGGWTIASAFIPSSGGALAGPAVWLGAMRNTSPACTGMARVVCMMRTKTSTVGPIAPVGAKLAFVAAGFAVGGGKQGADDYCEGAKPAALAGRPVKALLATTTTAASAMISAGATYARLDGTPIGTGADLLNGNARLRSGIWQRADGSYVLGLQAVLTGSADPSALGSAATTCADWANAAGLATMGYPSALDEWWASTPGTTCTGAMQLYCIEQ